MEKLYDYICYAAAAVGGVAAAFLGPLDGFLYTLIAFAAIDYVTGVLCAISTKSLSSAVGFKGICRKVLIFAMVGVGHLIDVNLLGGNDILRNSVVFFYLANEGISLMENASRLGVPLPEALKNVLYQLRDKGKLEPDKEEAPEKPEGE